MAVSDFTVTNLPAFVALLTFSVTLAGAFFYQTWFKHKRNKEE